MPKYRSKPVEVEAMQWLPEDEDAVNAMARWVDDYGAEFRVRPFLNRMRGAELLVTTIDGETVPVHAGDWAIREPERGRLYPCKVGIFAAKYEPVPDA